MMNRLIWLLLSFLALHATDVSALTVSINWDFKNVVFANKPDGTPYTISDITDAHARISSDVPMTVIDSFNDGFKVGPSTPPPPASGKVIDLLWSGVDQALNKLPHLGVTVTEENYNKITVDQTFFTGEFGTKIVAGATAVPGVSVQQGNSTDFTLYNDMTQSLQFSDIGFMWVNTEVPLSSLIPYTISGFDPILGTFTIGAGDSMTFDIGDTLGEYLLIQARAVGADGASSNVMFEHQVPEPSTIALMSIGLAGIGFSKRRCYASKPAKVILG